MLTIVGSNRPSSYFMHRKTGKFWVKHYILRIFYAKYTSDATIIVKWYQVELPFPCYYQNMHHPLLYLHALQIIFQPIKF